MISRFITLAKEIINPSFQIVKIVVIVIAIRMLLHRLCLLSLISFSSQNILYYLFSLLGWISFLFKVIFNVILVIFNLMFVISNCILKIIKKLYIIRIILKIVLATRTRELNLCLPVSVFYSTNQLLYDLQGTL